MFSIQVLTCTDKTLSDHLQELKNNEEVQLGNPKGRHSLWEQSLTRAFNEQVKLTFKTGFTLVVVTRADHLQERSQ